MKHLLSGVAVLLVCAIVANAQAVATDGPTVAAPKNESPKPVPILEYTKAAIDKVVQLSDDQKKAIDDIIATAEKSKQELAEAFKPIKESYDKARKDKDDKATARIIKDWSNLYKRQADINVRAVTDMLATLSAEKLDKWYDYNVAQSIKTFDDLKLNKDQIAKIKDEYIRLSKDSSVEPSWINFYLIRYSNKEILTTEQKTTQAMTITLGRYANVNFTNEQLDKMKKECSRLTSDPSVAASSVWYLLAKYVDSDVLTEAQKTAGKTAREEEYKKWKEKELEATKASRQAATQEASK